MKIGDVEVAKDIIEIRHQLIRTQLILENIINKNRGKIEPPTKEEMKEIETKALNALSLHYPNMVKKS